MVLISDNMHHLYKSAPNQGTSQVVVYIYVKPWSDIYLDVILFVSLKHKQSYLPLQNLEFENYFFCLSGKVDETTHTKNGTIRILNPFHVLQHQVDLVTRIKDEIVFVSSKRQQLLQSANK